MPVQSHSEHSTRLLPASQPQPLPTLLTLELIVVALKGGKASTPAQQEGYEEEPETDEPEQDLFATSEESHPEPSKAEIIAKAETFKKVKTQRPDLTKTRARLIESIHTAAALPPKDRMHQQLGAVRVGTLRRVVAASISVEQLEELRGVLKGWRVMGMRVTEKTAEEIVGEFPVQATVG